jgi:hypothetical protein
MGLEQLFTLRNFVFAAGALQFCQIPAMMVAPRMLGWKEDLEKLATMNRRIVKVIGLAIVLVGVGTGAIVACAADEMVSGSRLACGLSLFLGVFWGYRALVQYFLYFRIWPKGFMGRLSNYGLAALFTFQSIVYLAAFVANVTRT